LNKRPICRSELVRERAFLTQRIAILANKLAPAEIGVADMNKSQPHIHRGWQGGSGNG